MLLFYIDNNILFCTAYYRTKEMKYGHKMEYYRAKETLVTKTKTRIFLTILNRGINKVC